MGFLSWHYSQGINYYLSRWWDFLTGLFFYFNPILLLKSLFAPWKRLIAEDRQPGFNFTRFWENLMFNLISRGIGVVVRLFLIVVAIVSLVLAFILGFLGFLVWLLVPFLGLSVYHKIQSEPKNFLSRLFAGQLSFEKIWQSQAGRFVLAHTGLGIEEVLTGSKIDEKELSALAPQSFKELVEKLLAFKAWPDEFWRERQMDPAALVLAAAWWDRRQRRNSRLGKVNLPPTGPALELLFGYTPTLNQFSVDLTNPVSFAEHLIGRQNTVSRMARAILAGESVFLTGQPGVGKWTVVLEFAHRSKNGELDHRLVSSRILEVDFNSLLAESPDLNTKKAKLSAVINEASSAGNVVLVVRDFHRLVNPEVEGYDFTDVFEEKLKEGSLHLIAVSTNADYERFLAPNARLRPFFEKVEVLPPTKEEAELILLDAAENWERKKPVLIRASALLKILEDSDRFITETPFPEKALELLDAVIFYKEEREKTGKGMIITEDDVSTVLAEKTGIPLASLTENETEKLANLEALIHERLINQEAAVSFLARSLRVKRLGVINEDRPLGTFLFLGPTGVGKTETAKVLARIYYGSEEAILRFDMAEYAGQEGLERLIGSVAQNQPGLLTTAIKNKPASLLLLDELEKATPQILNLFLTLLDEGYLTDAFNQRVNGSNLFIIGTSNIAADYVWRLVESGVKGEELQKKVTDYILGQGLFPPEFLNRFDGVVVYEPLSKDNLTEIAKLMFADLAQELLKKDIILSFSPETVEKLVNDSYDPAFGARPMRRLVNLGIGDILSRAILKGEIKAGDKIRLLPGDKPAEFSWEKLRD